MNKTGFSRYIGLPTTPNKDYKNSSISKIVLFKSIRKCKRRNKGNFTSKSNSNKIKLCRGGGQHFIVLNMISTLKFFFVSL